MKGLGGLARQATYMRRLRQEIDRGPVLRVDGGDILFGHPTVATSDRQDYWLDRSNLVAELVSECSIDYIALGDADLALGPSFAAKVLQPLAGRLVCSNLSVSRQAGGQPYAPPVTKHVIVKTKSCTIGLFALLARRKGGVPIAPVRLESPEDTARKEVEFLRIHNCSIIILLSHLGCGQDRKLLESVEGIDIAVCGCCPGPKEQPLLIGRTLYCSAMAGGAQLGRLDIEGRDSSGRLVFTNKLVPMDSSIPTDWSIQNKVRNLELKHKAKFRQATADKNIERTRIFSGHQYCAACHPAQEAAWKKSPHGHAYSSLPEQSRSMPECLECHTTGFGFNGGFTLSGGKNSPAASMSNVQCEACHRVHPSHPRGRYGRVSTSIGYCIQCHTPTRSPGFDMRRDWQRVSCPRTGGHRPGQATNTRVSGLRNGRVLRG